MFEDFTKYSIFLSYFYYMSLAVSFCCLLTYNINREYVVDLVGEPGNVHGPDSSINGGISSMPSPLQVSHLKEFQQPYTDTDSKNSCAFPENSLYSGMSHFDNRDFFPITSGI